MNNKNNPKFLRFVDKDVVCKYKDKFINNRGYDINSKYYCDECDKECVVGDMHNVKCSDDCCLYHKLICNSCYEK